MARIEQENYAKRRTAKAIIRFAGPALEHHEIQAGDLAETLAGLNELCILVNEHLNDDRASVRLLVRGGIRQDQFSYKLSYGRLCKTSCR
jgi:hypothetical protein